MTITGRYICSVNRYYDKNDKIRGGLYAVLTCIVTITVRSIGNLTVIVIITARSKCTAISYCDNNDNNGEVYM